MLPGRRTIRCDGCAAVWPLAHARFCGRCGATLTRGGPRRCRSTERAPFHHPRATGLAATAGRWSSTLVALAAVGGVAVALTVAAGGPALDVRTTAPDPGVELPPLDALAEPVRPAPSIGTVAGAGGPTCQPAGCEAWRRPLDRSSAWSVGHGLLVQVGADQATAVDLRTGRERWDVSLGSLLPRTSDGTPLRRLDGGAPLGIAIDADAVAVGTGDRVTLLDGATGRTRWVVRSTGWGLAELALLPEVVLVTSAATPPAGDDHAAPWEVRLVALDRVAGTVRWQRAVRSPLAAPGASREPIAVIDQAGALVGVDPADGSERWRRELLEGGWATRAGPWLLVDGPGGHRLLDPVDGTMLVALDGWLGHEVRASGDGYVSVRYPLDPHRSTGLGTRRRGAPEVVALGRDGTVRWHHTLDAGAAWGCCTVIVPWDDGVLVASDGRDGLLLDPADGAVLASDVDVPVPEGGWSTPAGLLIARQPEGLVIASDHGGVVAVIGRRVELVSSDPATVFADGELLGLRARAGGGLVGATGRVVP